jgi:hypothetical protein
MHRPLPASPAVARRVGLPSRETMAREQAPLVRALQGWLSSSSTEPVRPRPVGFRAMANASAHRTGGEAPGSS